MKIISHRGNLNGPNKDLENQLDTIEKAIQLGFDVEVDIWLIENQLYLGHDKPLYKVGKKILDIYKEKLWIHCKNLELLRFLEDEQDFHYFWHEKDDYTLTSKNFIWSYPTMYNSKNIIAVMPELVIDELTIKNHINEKQWIGLCTDYPINYQKL
tara:strand:+ start:25 stop:489 length:465 start_codon:yes stop_codon:yes gene_type:complete